MTTPIKKRPSARAKSLKSLKPDLPPIKVVSVSLNPMIYNLLDMLAKINHRTPEQEVYLAIRRLLNIQESYPQ